MYKYLIASLTLTGTLVAGTCVAASTPEEPLKILVGFSAGGGTDQVARLFGNALQEELKQSVVVENRTGANGVLATRELVRAPADGNTIMIAINSLVTNELLYKNLSYRVSEDITPISLVSTVPFVLTSNNDFPAKNVEQLISYIKEHPGKVNYGSAGVGSPPHLFQVLFDKIAGTSTSHVPYRGSNPAMADLLGGHIDLLWLTTLQAMPLLKEERLRPYVVSTLKRSESIPNVPTADEEGVKGYHADMWWGFVGPAGIPADRLERLEQAFKNVVASPQMQVKLAELGSIPWGSSSEEFREIIEKENEKWAPLIKENNITLDE